MHRTPEPACGHHGCWGGWVEPVLTAPNVVTAVRTAAAVVLGLAGLAAASPGLLLASLACYWVGDVADGALARLLRQETRRGAAMDVVCDRVCCVVFYLPWAVLHPDVALPAVLYVAVFVLLDTPLSLAWLRWPLLSCNHAGRVDPLLHRLNWWPPVKALNTAGVLGLLLVVPSPAAATAFVAATAVLKAWSLRRVLAPAPAPAPARPALLAGRLT